MQRTLPRAVARATETIRSILEGRGVFTAGSADTHPETAAGSPAPLFGASPPSVPAPPSRRQLVRAGSLFLLTAVSTWLTAGAAYAVAILTILSCHEMGHYLMCRRYRVPASLPLFIPMPLISPFGTMGAIIRMRGQVSNRRILYDIGIAGPLAGIVPALFAVGWGLAHSSIIARPDAAAAYLSLGESLLFRWAQGLFFPGLNPDQEILLHPVAFAGWAGLFVTALNLLPIGQLDGGHVLYGLFGRSSWRISMIVLVGLGALSLLAKAA